MGSIIMIIILGTVGTVFIDAIPFEVFSVWRADGNIADWLIVTWPFLIFGLTFGILTILFSSKRVDINLSQAVVTSARAGIIEEAVYRWGLFLCFIPWTIGVNFVLGGFIGEGWGISLCFYHYFMAPLINVVTFGALTDLLYHPEGWYVGVAMLAANSFFREGYKYQGFLGYWNSWVVGLGLFVVFFKYGLIPSIIIHFLYDLVLFGLQALKSSADQGKLLKYRG